MSERRSRKGTASLKSLLGTNLRQISYLDYCVWSQNQDFASLV